MKKELYLFSSTVFISFVLHLLIVLKIYNPGNIIIMPLTIGMVFCWLYASVSIRDYITENNYTFANLLQKIPSVLIYILGFVFLYSVFNFFYTFSVHQEEGWVDFNLDHNKLQGISGFWILFYMIGFSGAFLKNYVFHSLDKKD